MRNDKSWNLGNIYNKTTKEVLEHYACLPDYEKCPGKDGATCGRSLRVDLKPDSVGPYDRCPAKTCGWRIPIEIIPGRFIATEQILAIRAYVTGLSTGAACRDIGKCQEYVLKAYDVMKSYCD